MSCPASAYNVSMAEESSKTPDSNDAPHESVLELSETGVKAITFSPMSSEDPADLSQFVGGPPVAAQPQDSAADATVPAVPSGNAGEPAPDPGPQQQ